MDNRASSQYKMWQLIDKVKMLGAENIITCNITTEQHNIYFSNETKTIIINPKF